MFSQLNMNLVDISEHGVKVDTSFGECFRAESSSQRAHSGALTIVLDSIFGLALFAHVKELRPIATINLKTEYLSPVNTGTKLTCAASCFALEGNIARMKGDISDAATGAVLATATAAFMTGTAGPSFVANEGGLTSCLNA